MIKVLKKLRDLGNTVIVVEHDEDTIRSADWIVDIGPGAGELGGEVVYSGDVAGLAGAKGSITGDYLARRRQIEIPSTRRKRDKHRAVTVVGARENNLKAVTVPFPATLRPAAGIGHPPVSGAPLIFFCRTFLV